MTKIREKDIASLTGIRFLAAASVVVSHGLKSVQDLGEMSGLTAAIADLSGLGMTLFFVLSGFVIQYNYSDVIARGGVQGFWKFFVARFSRLYPLFLVLLLLDFWLSGILDRWLLGQRQAVEGVSIGLPFYLTLTQS